jgi:protein DEK
VEKESHHKQTPRTPNPRGIASNKKTQNAVKKDKRQEDSTSSQRSAAVKTSTRIKKHKELQILHQDSQDVPARRKTSSKKSEMQDPEPSCCEGSTRKRKRGSGRKLTSRKQSQKEPKSDCKEITPITEPRNIIQKNSGNGPSPTVQPNIGDDTVANTEGCTEELSGIKGGVPCASDDWTEEQELTLRQAYFTARPSPHFWKKVSKMVQPNPPILFLQWFYYIFIVARAV